MLSTLLVSVAVLWIVLSLVAAVVLFLDSSVEATGDPGWEQ